MKWAQPLCWLNYLDTLILVRLLSQYQLTSLMPTYYPPHLYISKKMQPTNFILNNTVYSPILFFPPHLGKFNISFKGQTIFPLFHETSLVFSMLFSSCVWFTIWASKIHTQFFFFFLPNFLWTLFCLHKRLFISWQWIVGMLSSSVLSNIKGTSTLVRL